MNKILLIILFLSLVCGAKNYDITYNDDPNHNFSWDDNLNEIKSFCKEYSHRCKIKSQNDSTLVISVNDSLFLTKLQKERFSLIRKEISSLIYKTCFVDIAEILIRETEIKTLLTLTKRDYMSFDDLQNNIKELDSLNYLALPYTEDKIQCQNATIEFIPKTSKLKSIEFPCGVSEDLEDICKVVYSGNTQKMYTNGVLSHEYSKNKCTVYPYGQQKKVVMETIDDESCWNRNYRWEGF